MNSTANVIYFTSPSDPFLQTQWKIVSVIVFVTIMTVVWMLVALAAWNYDYPPIKSKGVFLIIAMVIGDSGQVIGNLFTTQLLDQAGPFFSSQAYGCTFFFWFPATLSLISVNIQNYRMYRLHFIVNRRLPIHSLRFWLPFLLTNVPMFVYLIFVISPENPYITRTPMNNPAGFGCVFTGDAFQAESMLFFASLSSVIAVLFGLYIAIQLRRLSASLNESQEQISIYSWLFVGFLLYILNLITLFSNTIPGKLYSVMFQFILPVRLCVILIRPVWNCYFNNEGYLREWRQGLKTPKDYKEANKMFGSMKRSVGGRQLPIKDLGTKLRMKKGGVEDVVGAVDQPTNVIRTLQM